MPLDHTCTTEERVVGITVSPRTSAGNAAPIDGDIAVTVSVDGGAQALTTPGSLSFDIVSGSAPGDTTFVVSADADLGTGVVTISDTYTLHVTGAQAASLALTDGQNAPK